MWVALRECERPIPSVEYIASDDCGVCCGGSSSSNKLFRVGGPVCSTVHSEVFQSKAFAPIESSGVAKSKEVKVKAKGAENACEEGEEEERCVRESPQCPMLMRDPPPPPQYHQQQHSRSRTATATTLSTPVAVDAFGASSVPGMYSSDSGVGVGGLGVFEAVDDVLSLDDVDRMPLFVDDLEDWTFPYV